MIRETHPLSGAFGKVAIAVWLCIMFYTTFQIGGLVKFYRMQGVMVKNHCAWYDMETGGFRVGNPPTVLGK